jgi:adenylate kinase family enzyme
MRRVAVIGCGGAGKTVLARRIGAVLGVPVIHADLHRHRWEDLHPTFIAADAWVIDAMRLATLDARVARADAVVFLDRHPLRCLFGVLRRRWRYRGGLHAAVGVADFVNWEFLRWIVRFRIRDRPRILEVLARHPATPVVVLRSNSDTDAFVASIAPTRSGAGQASRV